jgi:hypothetical protein
MGFRWVLFSKPELETLHVHRTPSIDDSMVLKFGKLVSSSNAFKDEGDGPVCTVTVQTDQPLVFTIEVPFLAL